MATNLGVNISEAASMAAAADYAVVFAGTLSTEGADRVSLSLDDGCNPDQYGQCNGNVKKQNELISAVASANPRTIVVLSVPGAVLMPWSNNVSAILTNFMPGQQAGNAIADILFGKVNPSARLPITFPNQENETEFTPAQWPGIGPNAQAPDYAFYTEKLLVGYRFYDEHKISFRTGFPFGHGLSYTTFSYSNLVLDFEGRINSDIAGKVSFTVTNTGKVAGSEVAQLYLAFPKVAGEPPLQLKGFKKTRSLAPGESELVQLTVRRRDISIWDDHVHAWAVVPGRFTAKVGASSRDWRLHGNFEVNDSAKDVIAI